MLKAQREHFLSLHDWHVPYHDSCALQAAFRFAAHLKPKVVLIHEVCDWYAISRFDRDPLRRLQLQEELDEARSWLKRLRRAVPDSRIIMLESNHDERLGRFLRGTAPELAHLRCLGFRNLLGLSEFNISYTREFSYRGFLWKHGDLVRKFGAYTAKNELAKEGVSGASGHTHRLGQTFLTQRGGEYTWIEGGCLCTLRPDYINGIADWQQGCSLVSFLPGKTNFRASLHPVIDGVIAYGDREFSGR